MLHALLDKLAENIGDYAIFQIEAGAQVIQVFDSWAGNLSPTDYDIFAAPYVTASLFLSLTLSLPLHHRKYARMI